MTKKNWKFTMMAFAAPYGNVEPKITKLKRWRRNCLLRYRKWQQAGGASLVYYEYTPLGVRSIFRRWGNENKTVIPKYFPRGIKFLIESKQLPK